MIKISIGTGFNPFKIETSPSHGFSQNLIKNIFNHLNPNDKSNFILCLDSYGMTGG
jgi:hypothetical protein